MQNIVSFTQMIIKKIFRWPVNWCKSETSSYSTSRNQVYRDHQRVNPSKVTDQLLAANRCQIQCNVGNWKQICSEMQKLLRHWNYPVWQHFLLLHDIEIVCVHQNKYSQIAYLDVIFDEYLKMRYTNFPNVKLIPKHRFRNPYKRLIMEFRPLIHLRTLSFDSKHCFFKKCGKSSQNIWNSTVGTFTCIEYFNIIGLPLTYCVKKRDVFCIN